MTNLKKKKQQLTTETDVTMCAATFNDQEKTVCLCLHCLTVQLGALSGETQQEPSGPFKKFYLKDKVSYTGQLETTKQTKTPQTDSPKPDGTLTLVSL